MIIHKFPTETIASETAQFIIQQLQLHVAVRPALLLLSGGSVGRQVAPILAQLLREIPQEMVSKLTLGLVDERFGLPWHPESNMLVIKASGLVEVIARAGGEVVWPLQAGATTIDTSIKTYNTQISRLFDGCRGRTLGIFGIGEDGHTAGIKPLPKKTFNQLFTDLQVLVVGYQAKDYKRITLTSTGIRQITTAVIFATGGQKKIVLEKLAGKTDSNEHDFPAGVFRLHQNVHIFTDQQFFGKLLS